MNQVHANRVEIAAQGFPAGCLEDPVDIVVAGGIDDEIDQKMGWKRGKKGGRKSASDSPRRNPQYWHNILRAAKATTSPFFRVLGIIFHACAKVALGQSATPALLHIPHNCPMKCSTRHDRPV